MRRFCAFLCVLASGSVAGTPADFVRGRVIEVVDPQIVQRATVPQDVYEWVSRADLGDLRVFNGQHSEVPYTLRRPTSQQEHSAWMDLPIFVLPVADASTSDGARVTVRVDDGGALVAVNGSVVTREQSAGLLIDASGLDRKISELMVTWIDAEDFFGKFQIDASDDLNSWRTVVKSSTLALLETGGHQVSADVIELPGVRARYLKVIQLDGSDDVRISTVQARSRQAELPPRQWKKITGTFSDDGYEYATEGFFPIDRVAVDFEQDTFMVVARLFSKSREKDTWRSRGQRTFYRVALDGATVSSEALAVSARDHYWRIEMKGENTQAPRLTVGCAVKSGDSPSGAGPAMALARPKSSTRTFPSVSILMFAGFRSRWTMPR